MKIKFRLHEEAQKDVFPNQKAMREDVAKKVPVKRYLLVVGGLSLFVLVLYSILSSGTVRTHGIIKGNVSQLKAPKQALVLELNVSRGDSVKKGDVLFILMAYDWQAEFLKTEKELRIETRVLEKELDSLLDKDLKINNDISLEKIEVKKLSDFFKHKNERYLRLQKLFKMGGAVKASVQTAKNEKELADNNLAQAKIRLNLVRTRIKKLEKNKPIIKNLEAEIAKKYKGLSLIKTVGNNLKTDNEKEKLSALELLNNDKNASAPEILKLRKDIGAFVFQAASDGIILEVTTAKGAVMNEAQMILSMESTNEIYLETYIDPDKGKEFKAGLSVTLYLENKFDPIETKISAVGMEVNVPVVLQKHIKDITRGIYVRIDIPKEMKLRPGNIIQIKIKTDD